MNNFKLIQEHFTQLHCNYCDSSFTHDSVKLIREEEDYWVVKVTCTSCHQSAGIAIVGIEYEEVDIIEKSKPKKLNELNKEEKVKFATKGPISFDDVLDAHDFIKNLGNDWMKYIK